MMTLRLKPTTAQQWLNEHMGARTDQMLATLAADTADSFQECDVILKWQQSQLTRLYDKYHFILTIAAITGGIAVFLGVVTIYLLNK